MSKFVASLITPFYCDCGNVVGILRNTILVNNSCREHKIIHAENIKNILTVYNIHFPLHSNHYKILKDVCYCFWGNIFFNLSLPPQVKNMLEYTEIFQLIDSPQEGSLEGNLLQSEKVVEINDVADVVHNRLQKRWCKSRAITHPAELQERALTLTFSRK